MPNKTKSYKEKFFTVSYINGRKKSPYRLRFKDVKNLGIPVGDELRKAHYFRYRSEGIKYAKDVISKLQATGQLVEKLSPQDQASILREAAALKSSGVDPIEAMREGAKTLSIDQKDLMTPIGDFWQKYYDMRVDREKWGKKHQTLQRQFYEDTKDGFMKTTLKSFIREKEGIKVVRDSIKRWAKPDRRSVNSVRAARSKMSCFLQYVASETDVIETITIKSIFSKGDELDPPGLKPEQENSRVTPAQAKYLIQYMSEHQCAVWIVLKLFMGARTELLQGWTWSIVEWESDMVRIPKKLTKNKKGDILFAFEEIPNFKKWIKWAWKMEGKPESSAKICNFSQPTITNRVNKAMNENKKLFVEDARHKLVPVETHRNFLRSGFISYGLQKLAPAIVMNVAEDRHNLDKYIKLDGKTPISKEAEDYWSLTPKNVFAEEK